MKFDNRILAELMKFEFTYPQIRRWATAFLSPDPDAGQQSGKSRQYGIDEAFTIVFGGYLVSLLRYKIPEAQRVVAEVVEWLSENEAMPTQMYDFDAPLDDVPSTEMFPYAIDGKWWKRRHDKLGSFELFIKNYRDGTFTYFIREIFENFPSEEAGVYQDIYRPHYFGVREIEDFDAILHRPSHFVALGKIRDLLLGRVLV